MSDYSLKTMLNKPERLAPGHRMCAGCGATIAEEATSAQDLVFTRHQLGRMATM